MDSSPRRGDRAADARKATADYNEICLLFQMLKISHASPYFVGKQNLQFENTLS